MSLVFNIHYNIDLPSIVRDTGGTYTATHQEVDDSVATFTSVVCDEFLVNEIKRIILVGYPAYLNTYSSLLNMVTISPSPRS